MKKLLLTCFILISLQMAAQIKPSSKGVTYGTAITNSGSVTMEEMEKQLATKKQYKGKVQGIVVSVCTAEGCWMKLKGSKGEDVMIKFKGHSFFVPKDILGKEVVLKGKAQVTTTSVGMLQHYAEDAGKSKEEIEKIKEPKTAIEFVADGVLVL